MKSAVIDGLCSTITSLDISSYFFSFSLNCIRILILEKQLRNTATDNFDSPIHTHF